VGVKRSELHKSKDLDKLHKAFALLGCYATKVDSWLKTFGTGSIFKYGETKVMHFLFNLLTINGRYMFRTLRAHPQQALNKRHLVYCMRVMSVGCTRVKVPL
jgi:hypothetical protein